MIDNETRPCGRLSIDRIDHPGLIEIALDGELDLQTAGELDRYLTDLDPTATDRVLIDLHGVQFMDSTGLASILRAHVAFTANNHALTFRPGSRQVQRLFALTGIERTITIDP